MNKKFFGGAVLVILCCLLLVFARITTTPDHLVERRVNGGQLLQKFRYSNTGYFYIFYDAENRLINAIDVNKNNNLFVNSYIRGQTIYSLSKEAVINEQFEQPNGYASVSLSDGYIWCIALPYISAGITRFEYLVFEISTQSNGIPHNLIFQTEYSGLYVSLAVQDQKPDFRRNPSN